MVAVAGSALSRPTGAGLATAAAVAAIALPLFRVPLALGLVAYVAVRWSKPSQILRGRTLSAARHRRAAAAAGTGVFIVAALLNLLGAGLDLAARLEARLQVQIDDADRAGSLTAGRTFRACGHLACIDGTIVELPTRRTLGIARLAGFTLHDEHAFGWRGRSSVGQPATAVGTAPAAAATGPDMRRSDPVGPRF